MAKEVSLQKTAGLQSLQRQVQVQEQEEVRHMGRLWQEQRQELLPDLEARCKPHTDNSLQSRKPQLNTASYSPPDSGYNELARKRMTASRPVIGRERESM